LGWYVTRAGEPVGLLAVERAMLDRSALLAWWLTWGCYWEVLVPVGIALIVVAWRFPQWRARIVWSLVTLLVCWAAADFAQHIFGRPRRLDWVVKHETSFSYPSSHAAIAAGFYGLWAWLIASSDLRWRKAAAVLLVVLVLAICWSRLALGAHYVTDLAGGILLAAAIVFAGARAVRR
jgi:membrane-associated phospholipid phosphatase